MPIEDQIEDYVLYLAEHHRPSSIIEFRHAALRQFVAWLQAEGRLSTPDGWTIDLIGMFIEKQELEALTQYKTLLQKESEHIKHSIEGFRKWVVGVERSSREVR